MGNYFYWLFCSQYSQCELLSMISQMHQVLYLNTIGTWGCYTDDSETQYRTVRLPCSSFFSHFHELLKNRLNVNTYKYVICRYVCLHLINIPFQIEEIDRHFFCKGGKKSRTLCKRRFVLLFSAVHLGTLWR